MASHKLPPQISLLIWDYWCEVKGERFKALKGVIKNDDRTK
ncbi:MAG: hypothetical protein ACTSYD_00085 [Candidatus Heimdallarchaeaceae archaeon]